MQKRLLLLLFIVTVASSAFASDNIKTAVAIMTGKPPIIDGNINPEEWNNAFWQTAFVACPGDSSAAQQSKFAIMFDKSNIYIAVLCDEIHRDKIDFYKRNDIDIWRHDSVELFFQNGIGSNKYKQFLVSAGGGCYGIDLNYDGWLKRSPFPGENRWLAAVKMTENGYAVEIEIPFSIFNCKIPENGAEWHFNILRNSTTLDSSRYSTWSPVANVNPIDFGYLIFATMDFKLVQQRVILKRKFSELDSRLKLIKLKYNTSDPAFVEKTDICLKQNNWDEINMGRTAIMHMDAELLVTFQNRLEKILKLIEALEKIHSSELLDSFF